MSGKKKSEWVYDELLCFLGSAFFQVPVTSFIEANCLSAVATFAKPYSVSDRSFGISRLRKKNTPVFDPSVEDSQEYKKIHREYKKVVETLLDAFTKDSSLSHEEVVRALTDMNAKQDLREIFQGLFEQVLAMDDFTVFVPMMVQKNIELQQQALMLIIQTTGSLPDSLKEGETRSSEQPAGPLDDDEEIMKKILAQSQREFDDEQKRKSRSEKKDKKVIEKTLAMSQAEVEQLEREKQNEQEKLNMAMSDLVTHESNLASLQNMPPIQPKFIPAQKPKSTSSQKPVIKENHVSVVVTPDPSQTSVGAGLQPKSKLPGISSSEAAANWLKSAQTESTGDGSPSSAVQKAAAALSGLSAEELKKRQEYLRQQRDKLVEMKRKEREKQLLTAEQSNPQRPMSARAARQTMDGNAGGDNKKVTPEEQKKLDMRRAIANKLKAELMGPK